MRTYREIAARQSEHPSPFSPADARRMAALHLTRAGKARREGGACPLAIRLLYCAIRNSQTATPLPR